jgi:hypothetical protein
MWQRWNGTSHVFEKSDDNGSSWAPLPLNANTITEGLLPDGRLSGNVAMRNASNIFTAGPQLINPTAVGAAYIGLQVAGSTCGLLGVSGALLGNANTDIMMLAETGKHISFVVNGNPTFVALAIGLDSVVTMRAGIATKRGSVSAGHTTITTLFACEATDQVALYFVRAGIGTSSQDANNYAAFATIAVEGASARIVANNTSTVSISLSGLTVQAQQSSGSTSNIKWVALKIV